MNLFGMLVSYGVTSAVLSNCGTQHSLATVYGYGIDPPLPKANQNWTFWVDYTLHEDVYDGIVIYEANLNGLPYYQKSDLCTETECPIFAGDHNETSRSTLFPEFIGKLITTVTWEDNHGNEILCLQGTFKTI
jgi:hypothetical protein